MSDFWIQTNSGVRFDLLEPTPAMVRLEDIAWALSKLERNTGHSKNYNDGMDYSVAEHSVLGSLVFAVPEQWEFAYQFLFHDAAEAYVNDVSRPLKEAMRHLSGGASAFDELEYRVWAAISAKFGLPEVLDPKIKEVDLRMFETERRYLLGPSPDARDSEYKYLPYHLVVPRCWTPNEARVHFMDRYAELKRYKSR